PGVQQQGSYQRHGAAARKPLARARPEPSPCSALVRRERTGTLISHGTASFSLVRVRRPGQPGRGPDSALREASSTHTRILVIHPPGPLMSRPVRVRTRSRPPCVVPCPPCNRLLKK